MSRSPNIDWYRHLSFAAVGGFFAAYAILLRMGVMANAQTLNLLELLLNSLRGNWSSVLLHTGALVIYMLGTMSTVILPHLFGWNMRRVCPLIDAACAVLLAFFPEDMSILPSLYPIFFAMSVQWSSFSGAQSNCAGCGSISPHFCASIWGPQRAISRSTFCRYRLLCVFCPWSPGPTIWWCARTGITGPPQILPHEPIGSADRFCRICGGTPACVTIKNSSSG